MDEMEFLVNQTLNHFQQNFNAEKVPTIGEDLYFDPQDELPTAPGVIYHIQRTASVFVIRTFVSANIRDDYRQMIIMPENYPSLRLLEGGKDKIADCLRFFIVENKYQAEIIHDQLNNRRFPKDEEMICNLSDPGFSWWMTKREQGFQVAFTLSAGVDEAPLKLGPLGDHQLAMKKFQEFSEIMSEANLPMNIENEMNRVQFGEGEDFLLEELKDIFEFGVVSDGLSDLFKILAKQFADHTQLETIWYYLNELAAIRRFWIQVQYDLNS